VIIRAISVDGARVRVIAEESGGSRPPALLVHGVGGWAENWRETLPALAASGRSAYAVDLPGFGESEPVGRMRYFEDGYPRFIAGVLDALAIPRVHLVGHSLGGAVAYTAAVSRPDRVTSLTLVAPGGVGREVPFLLRACALPLAGLLARLRRPRSWSHAVLRSCFLDASRIPPILYDEVERYGDRSLPEMVRVLRAGLTLRGVREDVRRRWLERAGSYRGPALVAWGREDAILPLGTAGELRTILPQAELRVIERCGHLAMVERPDEFQAALLPFLERADGAS